MLDSSSEDSGGEVVRMDHTRDDGSMVSQSMMSASDVVQMGDDDSMVIVRRGSAATNTNTNTMTNTSMASIGMAGQETESQRQGDDVVDEDSNEGEEESNS